MGYCVGSEVLGIMMKEWLDALAKVSVVCWMLGCFNPECSCLYLQCLGAKAEASVVYWKIGCFDFECFVFATTEKNVLGDEMIIINIPP